MLLLGFTLLTEDSLSDSVFLPLLRLGECCLWRTSLASGQLFGLPLKNSCISQMWEL